MKKAYIANPGKRITSIVRSDFVFLRNNLKEDSNAFVFSPKNKPYKTLTREHFTREINKFLKQLDNTVEDGSCIFRSHAFRKHQITRLWKDRGDVEEIKHFIGHTSITTTADYIADEVIDETKQNIYESYGELGSDLELVAKKDRKKII